MTTGSGDKPGGGSSPGRPAADTPGRLVVRSLDGASETSMGAGDTAVAVAAKSTGERADLDTIGGRPTPLAGTPALERSELLGSTLSGRYQITRKIGQGGMGAVYEATHTLIGKTVAVKVLLDKYAQREAIVKRLKQEAQLASSLRHEHIIDITDFGNTEDGRTFVVMELLEGESLAECLAKEPKLPEMRILRIASQAASALAAAHAKGIVHRDIKPENIFLLKRKEMDFVKVVDFGISKSLRATGEEDEVRLTQTGMVLGTPLYMSPEQARGDEDLDHRVDIYALGVIMYESATGRVPFGGNNYLSVISQVLNEDPKPVREIRPDISEEFEAIVSRAMAKERVDRYDSANDMLADISSLLDDPTHSTERAKITGPRRLLPRPKIPRTAWAIGGIGLAVGAAAIVVTLLMGSKQKKQNIEQPIAGATADAGVQIKPNNDDPVPPQPAVATIKLRIVTDPPGAEVYRESELIGNAPTEIEFVKNNKEVTVTAQLPGYDDAKSVINPLERKDGQELRLKLKKPAKGPPKTTKIKPTGQGSGSGATPTNHTGGELGTNPFQTGGTVQKK
jgi:serine/threonine protein kinase